MKPVLEVDPPIRRKEPPPVPPKNYTLAERGVEPDEYKTRNYDNRYAAQNPFSRIIILLFPSFRASKQQVKSFCFVNFFKNLLYWHFSVATRVDTWRDVISGCLEVTKIVIAIATETWRDLTHYWPGPFPWRWMDPETSIMLHLKGSDLTVTLVVTVATENWSEVTLMVLWIMWPIATVVRACTTSRRLRVPTTTKRTRRPEKWIRHHPDTLCRTLGTLAPWIDQGEASCMRSRVIRYAPPTNLPWRLRRAMATQCPRPSL